MKTRIFYTLLLLLLSGSVAMAQDEMFRVLASKGKNTIQTPGTTEWNPVFVGKSLKKNDKITVPENGYLGLAHKSGKTIELRKAGTYEVAKLASEVGIQNASAQKKSYDYLASEAKKSEGNNMARDRYKYMQATGSVEREVGALGLWAHVKDTMISRKIYLHWDRKFEGPYKITVSNYFEDEIFTAETNANSFFLDLENKPEQKYKITVALKSDEENTKSEITVIIMEPQKAVAINKQAQELQSVLGSESALNKIVLASFYEDQRLYMDALRLYEEAIKLEPEVEDYKIAYGQFLERVEFAKVADEKKAEK